MRSQPIGWSPASTRCGCAPPASSSPARRPRRSTGGQEAKADLKLTKLRSLSAHLTNAEWMHSMPGTEQQKKFLLNCIGCHTLERIMKSSYDAEGMIEVINRMATYYPGTTPLRPQRLAGNFQRMRDRGNVKPIVEWLEKINLSQQDTWQFPLKTLPRPTGKSTKVIFTEYDLPEAHIQPHDVVMDSKGNVWYSDFGQMFLGKMDPEDRQGDAISDPGHQARLAAGLARSRDRS